MLLESKNHLNDTEQKENQSLVLPPTFKYLSSKEHSGMTQYSFSFLTDYFLFFAADRRHDWKSKVSIICQHIGFICTICCLSLRAHLTLVMVITDFWPQNGKGVHLCELDASPSDSALRKQSYAHSLLLGCTLCHHVISPQLSASQGT